jgi:hypothetical protein
MRKNLHAGLKLCVAMLPHRVPDLIVVVKEEMPVHRIETDYTYRDDNDLRLSKREFVCERD